MASRLAPRLEGDARKAVLHRGSHVQIIASAGSGNSVQIALVGKDGVSGVADALGSQPLPYRAVVQVPGLAYQVRKDDLRKHMKSLLGKRLEPFGLMKPPYAFHEGVKPQPEKS